MTINIATPTTHPQSYQLDLSEKASFFHSLTAPQQVTIVVAAIFASMVRTGAADDNSIFTMPDNTIVQVDENSPLTELKGGMRFYPDCFYGRNGTQDPTEGKYVAEAQNMELKIKLKDDNIETYVCSYTGQNSHDYASRPLYRGEWNLIRAGFIVLRHKGASAGHIWTRLMVSQTANAHWKLEEVANFLTDPNIQKLHEHLFGNNNLTNVTQGNAEGKELLHPEPIVATVGIPFFQILSQAPKLLTALSTAIGVLLTLKDPVIKLIETIHSMKKN